VWEVPPPNTYQAPSGQERGHGPRHDPEFGNAGTCAAPMLTSGLAEPMRIRAAAPHSEAESTDSPTYKVKAAVGLFPWVILPCPDVADPSALRKRRLSQLTVSLGERTSACFMQRTRSVGRFHAGGSYHTSNPHGLCDVATRNGVPALRLCGARQYTRTVEPHDDHSLTRRIRLRTTLEEARMSMWCAQPCHHCGLAGLYRFPLPQRRRWRVLAFKSGSATRSQTRVSEGVFEGRRLAAAVGIPAREGRRRVRSVAQRTKPDRPASSGSE
jgi:hypothetical protein